MNCNAVKNHTYIRTFANQIESSIQQPCRVRYRLNMYYAKTNNVTYLLNFGLQIF